MERVTLFYKNTTAVEETNNSGNLKDETVSRYIWCQELFTWKKIF